MTTEGMHMPHPHRSRPALLTAAAALAVAGPLISAPPSSAAVPATAEVSPHAAQTIDDIGASGAWWVNDLQHFKPAVQARVAKLLFSKQGLDLSSYRYNIGGGGVAVTTPARAGALLLKCRLSGVSVELWLLTTTTPTGRRSSGRWWSTRRARC